MSEIKKRMKAKFQNENDSLILENKKCILLISTGQNYHENDYLSSTIDLINRSNFATCMISVADTLQRHNFLHMSAQDAYEAAHKMGDDWIKRNAEIINQLTPETTIQRWNSILQTDDYLHISKKLKDEYDENHVYRDAIHSTINNFIDRVKKRNELADIQLISDKCLDYLIEECPIIMPLWASQGYDYIIYPKPMTAAMAMTQEIFVKKQYPNKANWLSLKFKKLSSLSQEKRLILEKAVGE